MKLTMTIPAAALNQHVTDDKPCGECTAQFSREPDETRRKWLWRKLCPACERDQLKQRIKASVTIDDAGCWIWKFSVWNGFGQLSVRDENTYAHQLSYRLFVGQIPDGMEVCHKCDVKRCCNPDHFFLGTNLDNVRDMWAKGRGVPPRPVCGEANHKATLTDAQVQELRQLAAAGWNQRQLAARFCCSKSTAWRLLKGVSRP